MDLVTTMQPPHLGGPTFRRDGLEFRDLDHDGVLAAYEDWRLTPTQRATDLIGRMTLAEKVGLMVHGTATGYGSPLASIGVGTGYDLDALSILVHEKFVFSMISRLGLPSTELANQNNALQALAATGRLGIPISISTDPRNHFSGLVGASVEAGSFSKWPETLGLAATRDAGLVRRFGDVVRQEYRAVGFHVALSPQADLATSPRWPRIDGTFGEDPALVRRLVGAFVQGIQHGSDGLNSTSVAAVVKHWVGYGASRDGFDGHNYYGRYSAFPGGRFQDHVDAFLDAFAANVAGVMPTYNILEGLVVQGSPVESVGAGFNKQLLLGLLRGTYNYRGLVVSDWAITNPLTDAAKTGIPSQRPDQIAMPWGVEDLSQVEKFAKGVEAGLDQFGGVNDSSALLQSVREGRITEGRIDESAHRVLVQKFELGLFDNPFVDADAAGEIVGSQEFRDEGVAAQRRSLTLLKGGRAPAVAKTDTVYASGEIAASLTKHKVAVTDDLASATLALVSIAAPFEVLHSTFFFGGRQHEGDLGFADDHPDLLELKRVSAVVPTVVVIHLDRPAILTALVGHASTLIAEYGASADAVVDVLTGVAQAEGHLPFQLPVTMAAVLAQDCDKSNDGADPLFPLLFSAR